MTAPQQLPKWPLPLLVAGAICVFVATGMLAFESQRVAANGVAARAEVVDIDHFGSDSGIPRVVFRAGDRDVSVELANPLGRSYHVGQRIDIRYDPAAPSHACRDSFDGLYAQPMIAGGVGLMLLAAAIVFAVLRRRAASQRGSSVDGAQ